MQIDIEWSNTNDLPGHTVTRGRAAKHMKMFHATEDSLSLLWEGDVQPAIRLWLIDCIDAYASMAELEFPEGTLERLLSAEDKQEAIEQLGGFSEEASPSTREAWGTVLHLTNLLCQYLEETENDGDPLDVASSALTYAAELPPQRDVDDEGLDQDLRDQNHANAELGQSEALEEFLLCHVAGTLGVPTNVRGWESIVLDILMGGTK